MNPVRKRRLTAAALAAAALALAASLVPAAGSATPSPAGAENAFALALLGRLGASTNVVYSPYSIATAMTMAGAGARGQTATQIDSVLGASSSAAAAANAAALRRAIDAAPAQGRGAPVLDVANSLWMQRGLPLGHTFTSTLASAFGAPPRPTDFATAPQTARQTINAWVSSHTAMLIPSLLPVGSITPQTAFVLANAIYLKALWAAPFDPTATREMPFTTAAGRPVSVPFMSSNDAEYAYAAGPHWQAVDLPYQSSSLSLLALLPTGESLGALERTLTAGSLAALTGSLALRPVNLLLPKFHLHTTAELNATLEALGIRDAFGPVANFSGITTAVPLQISLVEHGADLRLDEQGTVAAAATVIVGPTAIAPPRRRPVTVNLDHPFLLLLREDRSGAILFVAQVGDPSAG